MPVLTPIFQAVCLPIAAGLVVESAEADSICRALEHLQIQDRAIVVVLDVGFRSGSRDSLLAVIGPEPRSPGHGTTVCLAVRKHYSGMIVAIDVSHETRSEDPGDWRFSRIAVLQALAAVEQFARANPTIRIVVNCSFGYETEHDDERAIISALYEQGVRVVGSAGNSGSDVPRYPGAYREAIAVASITWFRTKVDHSSYGTHVDICARGDVYDWGERHDGTSFAAGYVSGVMGELARQDPGFDLTRAVAYLRRTGDPVRDWYPERREIGPVALNPERALGRRGPWFPPGFPPSLIVVTLLLAVGAWFVSAIRKTDRPGRA